MKTNLVHTLFRVRKYGLMNLEKFKDVISPSDFRRCQRSKKNTWYSLTQGMFTSFLFQVLPCESQLDNNFILSMFKCFVCIEFGFSNTPPTSKRNACISSSFMPSVCINLVNCMRWGKLDGCMAHASFVLFKPIQLP